ncbi:hypothetical protein [Nostoc sp.]|uniref:hypothetical protein n=1 Tax=Nostoc sp. TaxID=1180 RepID=UPI002FFB75B6
MEGVTPEAAPWTRQCWQVLPTVSLPRKAGLLELLMVSLTGMHTWGSGSFGLTLGTGVRLWCAIGSKRCKRNQKAMEHLTVRIL